MKAFDTADLFNLKLILEAQINADYSQGQTAKSNGAFEFLIGDWNLVRTSFNAQGDVENQTTGTVSARYGFEGRTIQEDFYNYATDGSSYRGGTALYTYSPSTNQWHVAAVDASTGATSYSPTIANGEVRYDSVVTLPDREVYTRSRIFNIAQNSTEWEQQVSLDGDTWYSNYHIASTRKD